MLRENRKFSSQTEQFFPGVRKLDHRDRSLIVLDTVIGNHVYRVVIANLFSATTTTKNDGDLSIGKRIDAVRCLLFTLK